MQIYYAQKIFISITTIGPSKLEELELPDAPGLPEHSVRPSLDVQRL